MNGLGHVGKGKGPKGFHSTFARVFRIVFIWEKPRVREQRKGAVLLHSFLFIFSNVTATETRPSALSHRTIVCRLPSVVRFEQRFRSGWNFNSALFRVSTFMSCMLIFVLDSDHSRFFVWGVKRRRKIYYLRWRRTVDLEACGRLWRRRGYDDEASLGSWYLYCFFLLGFHDDA